MLNISNINKILIFAAHPDDFEIGCLGLTRKLGKLHKHIDLFVFSGDDQRISEQKYSLHELDFQVNLKFADIEDSNFPDYRQDIKKFIINNLSCEYDLILSHSIFDKHQDHKTLSQLTYNIFRRTQILEYEIPKYDVDTMLPNIFITLSDSEQEYKTLHLIRHFESQKNKDWYDKKLFDGLARLRGIQIHNNYAEAYYTQKLWIL